MSKFNISILLPSRGRTDILERSILSLLDNADDPATIELLLAFDSDDSESSTFFINNIAPKITAIGATYHVYEFAPLGYANLHQYLNKLAKYATAPWWVFWNDDAVMKDKGWDTVISSQGDRFCIQAFNTHNLHPYSIFPIVPKAWFDLLGHLSRHQLNDAYISQIAWLLDIMVRIDIHVDHERFDLTGKNQDDTYNNRIVYEGNIHDPRDFNHVSQRKIRLEDAGKISRYLTEHGYDSSHFTEVMMGKRDPWQKMLASDVNNMLKKIIPPELRGQ